MLWPMASVLRQTNSSNTGRHFTQAALGFEYVGPAGFAAGEQGRPTKRYHSVYLKPPMDDIMPGKGWLGARKSIEQKDNFQKTLFSGPGPLDLAGQWWPGQRKQRAALCCSSSVVSTQYRHTPMRPPPSHPTLHLALGP